MKGPTKSISQRLLKRVPLKLWMNLIRRKRKIVNVKRTGIVTVIARKKRRKRRIVRVARRTEKDAAVRRMVRIRTSVTETMTRTAIVVRRTTNATNEIRRPTMNIKGIGIGKTRMRTATATRGIIEVAPKKGIGIEINVTGRKGVTRINGITILAKKRSMLVQKLPMMSNQAKGVLVPRKMRKLRKAKRRKTKDQAALEVVTAMIKMVKEAGAIVMNPIEIAKIERIRIEVVRGKKEEIKTVVVIEIEETKMKIDGIVTKIGKIEMATGRKRIEGTKIDAEVETECGVAAEIEVVVVVKNDTNVIETAIDIEDMTMTGGEMIGAVREGVTITGAMNTVEETNIHLIDFAMGHHLVGITTTVQDIEMIDLIGDENITGNLLDYKIAYRCICYFK